MGRVDTADGDRSEDTVEIQTWQSTKCPVMYWFLVWRFHFNDTVACFTMNRLGDSLQSNFDFLDYGNFLCHFFHYDINARL